MKDAISIKRIETLHPKAKDTLRQFIEDCENNLDTTFRVAQAFRTFEEQNKIFAQPHDGIDNDGDGKIDEADERVTKVPGGLSYHNYGLAVDLVEILYERPNWNFKYDRLEPIAKAHGIKWGFRLWKFDKPHFHLDFGFSVRDLLKKYDAGDFIPGTKYVNL